MFEYVPCINIGKIKFQHLHCFPLFGHNDYLKFEIKNTCVLVFHFSHFKNTLDTIRTPSDTGVRYVLKASNVFLFYFFKFLRTHWTPSNTGVRYVLKASDVFLFYFFKNTRVLNFKFK